MKLITSLEEVDKTSSPVSALSSIFKRSSKD
jgi:hypothetical protein